MTNSVTQYVIYQGFSFLLTNFKLSYGFTVHVSLKFHSQLQEKYAFPAPIVTTLKQRYYVPLFWCRISQNSENKRETYEHIFQQVKQQVNH